METEQGQASGFSTATAPSKPKIERKTHTQTKSNRSYFETRKEPYKPGMMLDW